MKKLLAILTILLIGAPSASAASDPSLYFKSAVFDYYLEKTDTGTRMKVKETYEAVFSDSSSSHGPTRTIPFSNQNGNNITIDDLNITATRNGENEPIAKIEREDGYFRVNIGTSSKTVQGEQTYVLEYELNNVITEYDENGQDVSGLGGDHQELYWDTNGTGWPNRFDSLTANIHFAGDYPAKTPAYCYTGAKNSTARNCTVEKTSDGFTFKTTKPLAAYENLTFDIEFPNGTFIVPISRSYLLVFSTTGIALFAVLTIYFETKKYRKYAKEKVAYAKNLLVAPQYLPMKNLTVAEAGQIYLETARPTQTATLLELATSHRLQIISEETETSVLKHKKTVWKIKLLDDSSLTEPEKDVLKMLNGGSLPKKDEVIEIKKQTATRSLAEIAEDYPVATRELLLAKKLFEPTVQAKTGRSKTTKEGGLTGLFMALLILAACLVTYLKVSGSSILGYGNIVGENYLFIVIWVIVVITIIVNIAIDNKSSKYAKRTEKGLDASNYLEGLKLYISMAEKDRLEFNQSTKNAPKTDVGIVKLYEKLLPYACLFGLEESWLGEIQKYYDALDYSPDWYYGHDPLNRAMFYSMMNTTSSTITSNTAWHDSSSSSGFSGGGGGGFSGGGGGGGGGGSW
ncbi:DUF2207 domain-containing protein [Candidatus Saccharibacteria bacterium]|nr:DUF2207 domain-containing protein [Candidatus Saccharibacteria bacterium]